MGKENEMKRGIGEYAPFPPKKKKWEREKGRNKSKRKKSCRLREETGSLRETRK